MCLRRLTCCPSSYTYFIGYCNNGKCGDRGIPLGQDCDPSTADPSTCDNGASCFVFDSDASSFVCGAIGGPCSSDSGCFQSNCGFSYSTAPCSVTGTCKCGGRGATCTIDAGVTPDKYGRGASSQCYGGEPDEQRRRRR